MKEYVFAECIGEALAFLEQCQGRGRVIAGGTKLMMASYQERTGRRYLVNISRIRCLQEINDHNNRISIGAAVTYSQVGSSPLIQAKASALAKAARSVGSQQVRSVGTVVGNVVHAQPTADTAVVLVALGADAVITSRGGSVQVPVEDMYAGFGQSTVDSSRQLVTEVQFAGRLPGQGTGFARLSGRKPLGLPLLNAAAMLALEGNFVLWARIVTAPLGPKPVRTHDAEQFLAGKTPDTVTIAKAAQMAAKGAVASAAHDSHNYRVSVLPSLVERALTVAVIEAQQKGLGVMAGSVT